MNNTARVKEEICKIKGLYPHPPSYDSVFPADPTIPALTRLTLEKISKKIWNSDFPNLLESASFFGDINILFPP